MFKIGGAKEIPPIPEDLSPEGRDFVLQCLRIEPGERPTAQKLLEHPFLRGGEKPPPDETPPQSQLLPGGPTSLRNLRDLNLKEREREGFSGGGGVSQWSPPGGMSGVNLRERSFPGRGRGRLPQQLEVTLGEISLEDQPPHSIGGSVGGSGGSGGSGTNSSSERSQASPSPWNYGPLSDRASYAKVHKWPS